MACDVTLSAIPELCAAPGGQFRLLIANKNDVESIASIDNTTKKIPTEGIVLKEGKRFYDIPLYRNNVGGISGWTEEDIGTMISGGVYETVLTGQVIGQDSVARDMLHKIRTGEFIAASVGNDGKIYIAGNLIAGVKCRKRTAMLGQNMEEFNGQEIELYWKTQEPIREYAGTVEQLITPGAAPEPPEAPE